MFIVSTVNASLSATSPTPLTPFHFTCNGSQQHRFAPTTTLSGLASGTDNNVIIAAGDVATKEHGPSGSSDGRCGSLQQ